MTMNNKIILNIKPKKDLNHIKLEIIPINYIINKGITFNCKFLNKEENEVDNKTFTMDKIDWDNWTNNMNDIDYIKNIVISYYQIELSE